jgi:hypothetical protein
MTDEKPQPLPPTQQKIEYQQPVGGLPTIYSNNVALGPSNFELRLFFGEMGGVTPERILIKQHVEIVLSWVEAKILSHFLRQQIEAFEKKNGPIMFPQVPEPPAASNPFGDQSGPMFKVDVQPNK